MKTLENLAAGLVSDCDSEVRQCLSSGGSALPASTLARLRPKLPPSCEIKEGYGMTEVSAVHPIIHITAVLQLLLGWMQVPIVCRTKVGNPAKPGSVGRLLSNVEARVVDPDTG